MHELNQDQRSAVEHATGPLLVIAGAGTGKTSVITHRIAHILEKKWCQNEQVLVLTFMEKATAEIEERVDQLMPLGYEAIPIKTFHGFCADLLRDFGVDIGLNPSFRILQGVEHWLFLKDRLFEFKLDYYRPLGNPTSFINELIKTFGRFKEELNSPEDAIKLAQKKAKAAQTDEEKMEAKRFTELANAYAKYQDLLAEAGALDFADLHFWVIDLFKKRPNILNYLQKKYQYILVDEYQDTNIAQNRIVDELAAKHRNLTVVGDDDQAIYKFRGAAISNILQFQEKYPDAKKVVLTENYRSNQRILDFAYTSIQNNNPDRLEVRSGIDKKLKGTRPGDDQSVRVVHASSVNEEVAYVLGEIESHASVSESADPHPRLSNIAILTRTNAQLQPFVEALKRANIPYDFVSEKGLYHKEEVRDLIAVLRVLANPTDDLSFYRILRMPVFNLAMEPIVTVMAAAKNSYKSVWQETKGKEEFKFVLDTLANLLEYSKTHTSGEVLYLFTQTVQLYEAWLRQGTIEAEEKIVNTATFFNKVREFEQNSEHRSVLDFVAYLDLAEEAGENPAAKFEVGERDGIFVSTVHGAKGLEFHTVFLCSVTNDRFPSANRKDLIEIPNELVHEILGEGDAHIQEERRLFYVAVTRAKEQLHLSWSDSYGQSFSANPRKKKRSRFVDEVMEQVKVTEVEKVVRPLLDVVPAKAGTSPAPDFDPAEFAIESSTPKITQFSYSQLTTFEGCPRQYQYQYLLKIPQPLTSNLTFGTTMHTTLQEFYKRVMQSKQATLFTEFEPDTTLESLLNIYDEKWIDQGYESKAHRDARKERGKEILTAFYGHFKEGIPQVRFLEKGFKLKVGDYTISGRIDRADDLEDGTLEIIDYKSGKSKAPEDVQNDMQLFIYALATQDCFNLTASRLTLYYLDDDTRLSATPDAKKLDKLKKDILETANAINRSDFAPTPSQWKCKHCPFNRICDASMA